MNQERCRLSPKSVTVLTMIAQGHTYQQILNQHADLTYQDIFIAAQEAMDAAATAPISYQDRLARVRKTHPRAYEKWTGEEDTTLAELVCTDLTVEAIAKRLQRQPSAVRSRLQRFGYTPK